MWVGSPSSEVCISLGASLLLLCCIWNTVLHFLFIGSSVHTKKCTSWGRAMSFIHVELAVNICWVSKWRMRYHISVVLFAGISLPPLWTIRSTFHMPQLQGHLFPEGFPGPPFPRQAVLPTAPFLNVTTIPCICPYYLIMYLWAP